MVTEQYKIKTGASNGGFGFRWWTVVAYDQHGACLGADYHWLNRELAEHAKAAYEAGLAFHGSSLADDVQAAWALL